MEIQQGEGAPLPALLTSHQGVTFSSNAYTVLEAKLDRLNSTTLGLHFRIRLTNNDRYPTNFWNRTFRLLEDGIPRAPVSDLNETVDGRSAKEGSVEFTLPESVQQVVLQISQGNDVSELPFALPR